jgi:hypothetical protein
MAWFYLWHARSTVRPYIDRCVPFQITFNWIYHRWTQIKLYRNISRVINGNRMHMSSIWSLIAKVLNTYVIKVFMFIFNTFTKLQ